MIDLPSKFKIANHEIIVNIVEHAADEDFGNFDSATNTITVAKFIDKVKLTDEQVLNTFYHELIHCFQFYFDNSSSEAQAQCYANFIREFLSTKE